MGSTVASPLVWLGGLLVVGAAAAAIKRGPAPGFGPTSLVVIAFALWLVGTNAWANPSYTVAAPYHAAYLVGGFVIGRRAGMEHAPLVFRAALAFALCVAAWAIWQRVGVGEARSRAGFETPATLATTLNLLLVPGLVVAAARDRAPWLLLALLLLTAGLAAAASRGGWLGLGAGLVAAWLFARRAGLAFPRARLGLVAAIMAAGVTFATLDLSVSRSPAREHSMVGELAMQSSVSRLGLYQLALDNIARSSPLLGSGYLAFRYFLESDAREVPGYERNTTYFVHNDYLQVLLELGIPGAAGLVLLVLVPIVLAWRSPPRLPQDKVVAVALVAALCSMAAHAMVDFPFYIPLCVFIFAGAAGMLEGAILESAPPRNLTPPRSSLVRRAAVAAGATVLAWVLLTPAAAEAAAQFAHRHWRLANGEGAAYWFEVARRIEPRDWRYHWYAGQFWLAQAQQQPNPGAARLADRAFVAGDAANSREVANLVGRIATHRMLREQLEAPADAGTMRAWTARALKLAPRDRAVQAEVILVRRQFGP